jgi:hypothetical protein
MYSLSTPRQQGGALVAALADIFVDWPLYTCVRLNSHVSTQQLAWWPRTRLWIVPYTAAMGADMPSTM